ncbi:hypothetical protein KA344_03060 [bacterium]|jgi:hypothetical protein|nr:hypothetical protein [bacterium]
MSNNTKFILIGLAVCVVLGVLLQNTIFNALKSDLGGNNELLPPDQMAKKAKTEAIKNQKKFEKSRQNQQP